MGEYYKINMTFIGEMTKKKSFIKKSKNKIGKFFSSEKLMKCSIYFCLDILLE